MMDKETARRIVGVAVDFDVNISRLLLLSNDAQDEEYRKAIKSCAETIMGILNRDVILPLTKIYPDIDPDR